MAKFPVNQKKPNMKQRDNVKASHEKTPRVKLHPVGYPESEGDLGVLRIKPMQIPRQVREPQMSTGDSRTNHIDDNDGKKLKKIMKHQGMMA